MPPSNGPESEVDLRSADSPRAFTEKLMRDFWRVHLDGVTTQMVWSEVAPPLPPTPTSISVLLPSVLLLRTSTFFATAWTFESLTYGTFQGSLSRLRLDSGILIKTWSRLSQRCHDITTTENRAAAVFCSVCDSQSDTLPLYSSFIHFL